MKMNAKKSWAGMPSNKRLGIILVACMSAAVLAVGVYYAADYYRAQKGPPEVTTTTQVTTTRRQVPKALIERFAQEMIAYGEAQGLEHYDPAMFDQSFSNPNGTKRERSAVQMPFPAENIPEDKDWARTIESIFQGSLDYIKGMNNTPLPYFAVTYTEFDVFLSRDWE
jgi:hypothetical protein